MPGFDDILSDIKTQVMNLAKAQVQHYAVQAAADTNAFLESTKEKLKTWTEQLAAGAIDKEEFLWLLNSQQALGQMKILTEAGLAQVAIDAFTSGVRKIVTNSLLSLAGKLL